MGALWPAAPRATPPRRSARCSPACGARSAPSCCRAAPSFGWSCRPTRSWTWRSAAAALEAARAALPARPAAGLLRRADRARHLREPTLVPALRRALARGAPARAGGAPAGGARAARGGRRSRMGGDGPAARAARRPPARGARAVPRVRPRAPHAGTRRARQPRRGASGVRAPARAAARGAGLDTVARAARPPRAGARGGRPATSRPGAGELASCRSSPCSPRRRSGPFVGRERRAWRSCARALAAAAARRAPLRAGSRASPASARRAWRRVRARGPRRRERSCSTGAADEEALVPYQPFVDLISHLVLSGQLDRLGESLRFELEELGRLVPELRRQSRPAASPPAAFPRPSATGSSRP